MIFQSSALIGLGVIIIAWIIQLAYSWKGNSQIKKRFLIIYAIGVALLIIDSYVNDSYLTDVAVFNLISLILAMIVLIRIGSKKSGTSTKSRSVKKRRR